jgi:hypothetical protein
MEQGLLPAGFNLRYAQETNAQIHPRRRHFRTQCYLFSDCGAGSA